MRLSHVLLHLFAMSLACVASANSFADDQFVKAAKSLAVRAFDPSLPEQSLETWLPAHLPVEYEVVWNEGVTDCGEGTGSAIDADRNMPLCAEVLLKRGPKIAGYLAFVVGTAKQGLLKDGGALYFGYLEHAGKRYNFKRLSDVLQVR